MASDNEKIVVIGASPNPERYSYKAVRSLLKRNYNVVAIGIREGNIEGLKINTDRPVPDNVHSLLMYIDAKNQPGYYEYILDLKPKRIIFNPGTENHVLAKMASDKGIEVLNECVLSMLSTNNF
jgi:uncharacterized protein